MTRAWATSLPEAVRLLELAHVDEHVFGGEQSEMARATGHVFGGLVAAQAVVAGYRTVTPDRPIHSLHAYFLRPGDPAQPVELRVEVTRDGRSFSHRKVSAVQHGRAIMEMACSFAIRESGLRHQSPMPDAPDPETLPTDWEVLQHESGIDASLATSGPIDVRTVGEHSWITARRGESTDRSTAWMRTDGELPDDQVVHDAMLVYASDLTILDPVTRPHARSMGSADVHPTTIDHAVWFHAPLRADRWWLYDVDSPWAGGGRGFARGRVFDRAGTLVAEVAQEGLMRVDDLSPAPAP